jgi:predicted 2-oxoglutarate/Fe(II)-dependent dioxygenase YbiX
VRDAIPPVLAGHRAVGLNERFRLYRYAPSQRFSWHTDGAFRRDNGETSLVTFMVYLNEGYRGGATLFEDAEVVGRTGMALVFRHALLHEGATVVAGRKYALRSDVMYGPL